MKTNREILAKIIEECSIRTLEESGIQVNQSEINESFTDEFLADFSNEELNEGEDSSEFVALAELVSIEIDRAYEL